MPKRVLHSVVVICLCLTAAFAADDPLVGKWRFNPSRSTIIDYMIIESAEANRYAFAFTGSPAPETIAADGTFQPGMNSTTLSATILGPRSWKIERRSGSKPILTAFWKLSPDGKTLTDMFTSFQPDGSTSTENLIYKRTSGSSGIPGTWERIAKLDSPLELEVRLAQDGGIAFVLNGGAAKVIRFDGKEYADSGASGFTSTGRRIGDNAVEIVTKINGKITERREITVSADRKTLTRTMHVPGPSRPTVLVFDRE